MKRVSFYFVLFFSVLLMFQWMGCTKDKDIDDPIEDNNNNNNGGGTTTYVAPAYADDYAAISSWNSNALWNLANVHDPSVVFDGEYYYMYGTDASYGNVHVGKGSFPYRRSKNLVNWEFRGMAMAQTPAWIKDSLNLIRQRAGLPVIDSPIYGNWAPVVRKVGNKYRMYYSVIIDNYIKTGLPNTPSNFDGSWTERAFIGLMETDNLATNNWVDKGMVVMSVSDRGNNYTRSSLNDWSGYFKYNAIDPTYIVTPQNEHYLIYGSWHSGIVALKVDSETGKPAKLESLADYGTLIARRENNDANRWQALEGPEIVYNAETGYYYLFLAYDELSVAYNTRVCRSQNIMGPYFGYDGKNISQGGECWPILTHPYKFNNHSGWVGISHCAVFKNESTGEWFYSSQGRLPENTAGNLYSNAIMMGHIRKIRWTDDGWPVIMPERYANVPQSKINESELLGSWENITLNYAYRSQQTSTVLSLSSDKRASGALTGTWSFDADKSVLTIGTQKLYVERELNWERSPRIPTIVYSGINASGRSVWGIQSNYLL